MLSHQPSDTWQSVPPDDDDGGPATPGAEGGLLQTNRSFGQSSAVSATTGSVPHYMWPLNPLPPEPVPATLQLTQRAKNLKRGVSELYEWQRTTKENLEINRKLAQRDASNAAKATMRSRPAILPASRRMLLDLRGGRLTVYDRVEQVAQAGDAALRQLMDARRAELLRDVARQRAATLEDAADASSPAPVAGQKRGGRNARSREATPPRHLPEHPGLEWFLQQVADDVAYRNNVRSA